MELGNDFLEVMLQAQDNKIKNKQGPRQPKVFLPRTRNNPWNEKAPMDSNKIFANHVVDKGLICKIWKELIRLNSNDNNNNPN